MKRRDLVVIGWSICLWACGGASTGTPDEAAAVLFEGDVGDLLPHAVGAVARFRVTARSGAEEITTRVTTTVLSEGPGGAFLLETTPEGGPPRRVRARQVGDTIEANAFATLEDGYSWRQFDPAHVLAWTPLLRGEGRKSGFRRDLEVVLDIDGQRGARTVTFSGELERTPRALESISFGGADVESVVFAVTGEAVAVDGTGAFFGATKPLRLSLEGTEFVAPQIGRIRDEAKLTLSFGDTVAVVTTTSARIP